MIELNGIYKLKKIKGMNNNDDSDYRILALGNHNGIETVYCENLTTGEHFCFLPEFFVDPEKPDEDAIFELIKIEK